MPPGTLLTAGDLDDLDLWLGHAGLLEFGMIYAVLALGSDYESLTWREIKEITGTDNGRIVLEHSDGSTVTLEQSTPIIAVTQ